MFSDVLTFRNTIQFPCKHFLFRLISIIVYFGLIAHFDPLEGRVSHAKASDLVGRGVVGQALATGANFAFIEWNPAALKDQTVSVAGEYLVIDGVSFGTLVRATDRKLAGVELSGLSVGGTVTQYLFEETLSGLFLRGDFSVFVDKYKTITESLDGFGPRSDSVTEETGYNTGASLGAMIGYRFMFANHVTGSAGYGFVKNIPDFFRSEGSALNANYVGEKGNWRFDVLAGIGVSF